MGPPEPVQAGPEQPVENTANHNPYKVEVHEANHPEAEHWIADLVDPAAGDYHSARDLPPADLLAAGVSCVNHSQANTIKAYEQGMTLFELADPDYEARVTRSERDRATANCVLHYAAQHHPRLILVECTTELTSWGPAVPGRAKVGDGTTYRWWIKQFDLLNYDHKALYLNSQFFGVPQSRDRLYIAFWDRSLPAPDLEHRPLSRCHHCDRDVEAVWTWRTGIPPTGSVRYGKQYEYRCASCRRAVVPPMAPALAALDLTDLGTRIGDRARPLAASTMARAERCRQRFADFPAVLMPARSVHGAGPNPWQTMVTQASQQDPLTMSTGAIMPAAWSAFEQPAPSRRTRGLDQPLWMPASNTTSLTTAPIALAIDNFQGGPRGAGAPLPTQVGSETLALLSSGVVPFRQNTVPTVHGEAMPTVTSDQIPGLLTAAWASQEGPTETEAARPALSDSLATLTTLDPTAQLVSQWRSALADLPLEECYFRMMRDYEVGRGCGFDVNFVDYHGTFKVWGSVRAQVDGYGNAVSPQVGDWIGARLKACLHSAQAPA